jgi:hypothetical protein
VAAHLHWAQHDKAVQGEDEGIDQAENPGFGLGKG